MLVNIFYFIENLCPIPSITPKNNVNKFARDIGILCRIEQYYSVIKILDNVHTAAI